MARVTHPLGALICAALLILGLAGTGQDGKELVEEKKVGSEFVPARQKPTEQLVQQLKVPDGFRVNKFAEDLSSKPPPASGQAPGGPRMLAVGPDGTVYITRRDPGDVLGLRDTNGDGKADDKKVVARGLPGVHGIVIHQGKMYLCTAQELYAAEIKDGAVGPPKKLIGDLPPGGRHPNRTLGFGPDGNLYISVGSTCNCCVEKNPESATILRAKPDGSDRKVFARGLRNTVGFGWHPATKQLWGMDHGSDWLGDDVPPEELNLLEEGKDYGWPFIWGDRKTIPLATHPKVGKLQDYAAKTTPPVLGYQAHSAPIQMAFYAGKQFPQEYHGDAFVAMRGSWNRKPSVGYEVVRIKFDKEGKPLQFQKFLTGFLVQGGQAFFGRPAGLAVAADGALLVGDDIHGVIYRVSYKGLESGDQK
jgi:glucose/arabinose dehydrogenase